MKILPPQTQLPANPTIRRHNPKPTRRWALYRACLRWDFGFTCPFCMLHEADLFGGMGGEGLGGVTVEHRIPRSEDDSWAGDYSNCLLACAFCNRARSNRPIRHGERRLLDPTEDSWANHFVISEDRIEPVMDDPHATYTYESYDLNDNRKVLRRQKRRRLIQSRLKILLFMKEELNQLLELAERERTTNPQAFSRHLQLIKGVRAQCLAALSDLARYAAIPHDAPASCRCETEENHSRPEELARQTLEVSELASSEG